MRRQVRREDDEDLARKSLEKKVYLEELSESRRKTSSKVVTVGNLSFGVCRARYGNEEETERSGEKNGSGSGRGKTTYDVQHLRI